MSHEDEARKIMKQFAQQQELMSKGMNPNPGGTQPNEKFNGPINPQEQSILTNVQNSPPPTPASNPNTCPQCGTIHPPIRSSEKCPLASMDDEVSGTGLNDTIIASHLVNMRNIIISQMSTKNIKDGNKFFVYAIVELTNALEKYSE